MYTDTTKPSPADAVLEEILALLPKGHPFSVEVHAELPSTNDRAKALGANGAPGWTAVLALAQGAGRGRMGRGFFSPPGGVYLSLLLRPDCAPSQAGLFAAAASVAVCRAARALCGAECGIKWPNDLQLDGKKVCGILAESTLHPAGRVDYAVLGVGLNLFAPPGGFPPELSNAGALLPAGAKGPSIAEGAAALLTALHEQFADMPHTRFLPEYRKSSLLIGKPVFVLQNGEAHCAVARRIDDAGRLVVEYPGGTIETLYSGEVSIRETL